MFIRCFPSPSVMNSTSYLRMAVAADTPRDDVTVVLHCPACAAHVLVRVPVTSPQGIVGAIGMACDRCAMPIVSTPAQLTAAVLANNDGTRRKQCAECGWQPTDVA